ncbi:MAG TPA: bifunctional hydroxymethylpyrimidine kinase/phosphomethylpyrimidine kinase [Thermoanaerobaculia bacterium]|nr:bifunctional hydroxymethylpyrimidine kinase/phosphomethylpyrimidine kinase [Thermoanaerobaculia bacterium]
MTAPLPVALTIAGVDPSGGAGIVADLMTFAAHRVFGTVAVAAITAQNTREITKTQPVAAALLFEQISAVLSDIVPHAVKVGMLGNAANVSAAARALRKGKARNVVLDPVLVATTGSRLLPPAGVSAMKRELFPLAAVVTPNLPEAETIAGFPIRDEGDRRLAAGVLADLGADTVLIKGGHGEGREVSDLFFDGRKFIEFRNFRIETGATHGTGCTLSSAIAANLARGAAVADAVRNAIEYLRRAMGRGLYPGKGAGTPGHF